MGSLPARKNVAYTLRVPVVEQAARPGFKNSPTYAAGDIKVKTDAGSEANPAGGGSPVTVDGYYFVIDLTASEMNGDLIMVRGKDAAGAEWDDFVYEIRTTDYTYQAKLTLLDDNSGSRDLYIVTWYKDGELITSGITNAKIYVFTETDTDLIGSSATPTAMTEIGSKHAFKYAAVTSERIANGTAYVVQVTATIDGATRTWYQPVFRDSF